MGQFHISLYSLSFEVLASVSVISRVLFTSVVIVTLLHRVLLVDVFKAGWFILGL